MPSFLIRGLAHYFAASAMESRARRQSSFTPSTGTLSDDNKELSNADIASWKMHMRWLIPLAQATGFHIVIDNPKSHEQIIIDQNTKVLPELTLEWMQKYNKQELLVWMEKENERQQQKEIESRKNLENRRIEEARGRERFGKSFTLDKPNIQDEKIKSQKISKGNYVMPIICLIYVFIIVLIGLWVYKSSIFEHERHYKDWEKYNAIMLEAENSPITEFVTPDGLRFDMNENDFNSLNSHEKTYIVNGSKMRDYSLGNIHYLGNDLYSGELFEDKLFCYEITIRGRMSHGSFLLLSEDDVENICDYYQKALGKDYTYASLPDYFYLVGKNNQFYILKKNNMVITLHYWVREYDSDNNTYLIIKCENRPVSAPIESERYYEKRKNYRPRFESQYPYSRIW